MYVEINDTTYGMKYGHSALKKFMHKYGLKRMVDLGELPNKLTFDDMPEFVKAGFDTYAKCRGDESPFSLEEIKALLEEYMWLETVALEAFGKSMTRPQTVKESQKAEVQAEGN